MCLFVCVGPSWQTRVLRDEVEIPQSSSRHHRLFSSTAMLLLYTLCVATGSNSADEKRHRSCVFVFDNLQKMTKESFASIDPDRKRIDDSLCAGLTKRW